VLPFAGVLLLVGLGVLGAWLAYRPASRKAQKPTPDSADGTDPRRTYAGPYRNINPDVHYVGDALCFDCHKDVSTSYAQHPMGRSLVPVASLLNSQTPPQMLGPQASNPFAALGRRFLVVQQGQKTWHRQAVLDERGKPLAELAQQVDWVIGSGQKGYSYLAQRDGYLLQTPISWFTQKARWDLSPGFGESFLAGRIMQASCLFCHANRLQQHPEHPDRFLAPVFQGHAIGCERCHGPGELHVQGDLDHTIVNPARLSPPLRDAVCEQCHLEGEARVLRAGRSLFDYRPGLPLHDFWAVLVHSRQGAEDARAVSHVEQMYQSKCFSRPVGSLKLGCTSCHNPHLTVAPKQREEHYRAACHKCHNPATGQRGCSLPLPQRLRSSPRDSCIDCHMPRYTSSDIAHTASTDHRIVRRPLPPSPHAIDLDGALFADFYRDRFPKGDVEAERTLALGVVKMLSGGILSPKRHAERAVHLLESALGQYPRDDDLRESKAQVLALLGRHSEALAEAQVVLARRPEHWRLLARAAGAAQALSQSQRALDYWREAVRINPFVPEYQVSLIALLLRANQLDEARERCESLLRLDPLNVAARQAWIGFLLQQGKKDEARRAFAIIRRLKPPDLPQREEWFKQQMSAEDKGKR
jgi:hypothetical protein